MENKTEEKNISKQIEKKVSTKVFVNLIIAVVLMIYFCIMSVIYKNVQREGMINIVKVCTMIFLGITILLIELAYRKESKSLFIHSVESLALSVYSLTTMYVVRIYNFDFKNYIILFSYLFSIYYVLKAIIISTKARKEYLNSLSDISEIVQKEEPKIKEATKREKEIEEEKPKKRLNILRNKINVKKEESKNKEKSKTKEENKEEKKEKSKLVNKDNKEETIKTKKKTKTIEEKEEKSKKISKTKKEDKKETEETTEEKPKRKRGRPKKEVKIDD